MNSLWVIVPSFPTTKLTDVEDLDLVLEPLRRGEEAVDRWSELE